MTFKVPQTIADDLFTSIEQWIDMDSSPDNITLQRLERDAINLGKVSAALSSIARAAIYAISWNFDEANYWLKNALRLDSSPMMLLNAALTYKHLNRLDLAAEISMGLYDKAPRDENVVNSALMYITWAGDMQNATRIYAKSTQLGVRFDNNGTDMSDFLECMQKLGVRSERLIFEANAAYKVLAANRKRIRGVTFENFTDLDGQSSLVLKFTFQGDLNDEFRLETQLASILVEQEGGWNPTILSTEFEYEQVDACCTA